MRWLAALLSNAPGTPAVHNLILILGTLGFLAIALNDIAIIDPVTYCSCVGILAGAAGGSALAAAGSARIENGKTCPPPVSAPEKQ